MIKSMTGYGRASDQIEGMNITVEIKSVNHRFFEFAARMPRAYGFLEEKLKSYFQQHIARGKIDCFLQLEELETADAVVQINHSLAAGYVAALQVLAQRYNLREDCSASVVARFPDLLVVRKEESDENKIWAAVQQVAEKALIVFLAMRTLEGKRMQEDMAFRLQRILQYITQIEEAAPQIVEEYNQKLKARIQELLDDVKVDEQRLLTEVAIFSDRIAVAEETVRLRSHIDQCAELLQTKESVGRKLDFLLQEMNREANTIGSKIQNVSATRIVVEIKAELEKIREQVQNIE